MDKEINKMGKGRTSDSDLYKLAKEFKIRNLRVCYASEINPYYNGPQIVNLDHVGGAGTHWCAYYHGTYFDPLGCPPPPPIAKLDPDYNEMQVQNVREEHCGSWCIAWLSAMQKNKLAEFYEHHEPLN